MSENPNPGRVDFTIDSSQHALEGDLLPPKEFPKDEETVKRPISRAAAVKSMGALAGGLHWVGARALDEPALELSKDEAKVYGEASVDVLKAHGIDLATHPKVAAWINLSVVALEIDGPRVILVLTKPPEKKYTEAEEGEIPPLVFPEKPSPTQGQAYGQPLREE